MALLTVSEVAQRLGMGKRTVYELLRRGDLPRMKIGSATRIDARDVEAYVDRLRREGLGGAEPPVPEAISAGQLRAFHAIADKLDRQDKAPRGAAKARALEEASSRFGREIRSAAKISSLEASEILDWLEEQVVEAPRSGSGGSAG